MAPVEQVQIESCKKHVDNVLFPVSKVPQVQVWLCTWHPLPYYSYSYIALLLVVWQSPKVASDHFETDSDYF